MKKVCISSVLICISLFFASCNKEPEAVNYGKDKCAFCNMTIIDSRYAASLLDLKGETIKFDDIQCMMAYSNKLVSGSSQYYVSVYDQPDQPMINCEDVFFLKNELFPGPMSSGYAAFLDEIKAKEIADSLQTKILFWKDVMETEWKIK